MGKKFAPNYVNLFMAQWENTALENAIKKQHCTHISGRYMDFVGPR